jgi:hypothetical protein
LPNCRDFCSNKARRDRADRHHGGTGGSGPRATGWDEPRRTGTHVVVGRRCTIKISGAGCGVSTRGGESVAEMSVQETSADPMTDRQHPHINTIRAWKRTFGDGHFAEWLRFLEITGAKGWKGGRDQTAPGRRRSLSQHLRPTRCQGGVGGVDPVGLDALRSTPRTAFAGGQYGSKRSESCNGDPVGLAALRPTLQSTISIMAKRKALLPERKIPGEGTLPWQSGKVTRAGNCK